LQRQCISTDMKMTDQFAGHEIARHENAGHPSRGKSYGVVFVSQTVNRSRSGTGPIQQLAAL